MSILNEDQLLGAPGSSQYQIQRSLRFNSSDSAYLSRTPGGEDTTWTFSCWVKRSKLGTAQYITGAYIASTYAAYINFHTDDTLRLSFFGPTSVATTAVYRDVSAWYHIVVSVTSGSASYIYVNGQQAATWTASAGTYLFRSGSQNNISGYASFGGSYFDGYLSDIYYIGGQALTPASFGQTDATTGQWVPIAYTGTYGTNGFKLNFSNNSAATATTLGADSSGNGNNWTPNNLSVTAGAGNDSLVDTPTSYGTDTGVGGEVRGNYCTLNPLAKVVSTATPTISEGNLKIAPGGTGDNYYVGTQTLTGGKFYYEVTVDSVGGGVLIGVCPASAYTTTTGTPGTYRNTGVITDFAGTSVTSGSTFTTGDVIGVAVDIDAGTVKFYKNNAGQGATPSISFTAGTPVVARGRFDQLTGALTANFGQRPFAYTAPSGYKALCDTNLPAPTIVKPSTVMDVKLYTGNGSTQTISGLGFESDLLWIKRRDGANSHQLTDSVRGLTKYLFSDATLAEETRADQVTATSSTGFSVGSNAAVNANAGSYAAWCWDAGSSTVTNTAGTISSQVRANASAGFSIVTWSVGSGSGGFTVGHGLGVTPGLIIWKPRVTVDGWYVWHSTFAANEYARLDQTAAKGTSASLWNNTAPTSSVMSGSYTSWGSYGNMVAYCFAPVAGYSAFGSYTGNGSTTDTAPFVYTGFRPRWILLKDATVSGDSWIVFDSARDAYNVSTLNLFPNLSSAENNSTNTRIDILSNGFKIRCANATGINANNSTMVFAAFAEFPFQYARAR